MELVEVWDNKKLNICGFISMVVWPLPNYNKSTIFWKTRPSENKQ